MRGLSRFRKLLLLVLALTIDLAIAAPASAWWSEEWSARAKMTIDASPTGVAITDPIGGQAILVRLHTGNFRFEVAREDGSDIRFVAEDDKTPLKHHIEKFDGLMGEGFVWVRVPEVRPGAQTDFYIYYGNNKAPQADDPKGTYDSETVLVYHFSGRGEPARDYSGWANNAQTPGLPTSASLIGPGAQFDGQTTITVPASPPLLFTEGGPLTWSAWFNETTPRPNAILFSRQEGANAIRIGLDNGQPFVEVANAAGVQRSVPGAPVAPAAWHHLAVVFGQQIDVFLDGAPYAALAASLPVLNSFSTIGGDPLLPESFFIGELDELQIAKVARPIGFIRAAAVGQGGALAAQFLTHGGDEETSGSGYFTIIIDSVTLDGWIVIGILAVMAVVSWIVMFQKSRYVGVQVKANRRFLEVFGTLGMDLTVLERFSARDIASIGGRLSPAEQRAMKASSLYRIFCIGAEQIRLRSADGRTARALSSQTVAAIRASLDSGVTRESQKLNGLMVLLTIAISGGPFLGLLGTVVGVMITFGAIAAAGDVNVNSIAPGIAAALVATIAGLAVAIPALFGYNYITAQIKDVTTDLHVFVDEYVTRVAESFHARTEQRSIAAE